MELPKWAFKTESAVRRDGSIDMVFRLRPLGRLWLYWCAIVDLIRTATITITIEFQDRRPVVTHDGERVEPSLDYSLEDKEVDDLVKRIPIAKLPYFIELAKNRHEFATTPAARK